jgi:NADH-quinone oxidoreductase subunit N
MDIIEIFSFFPEIFLTTITLGLLVYGLLNPHFENICVLSILGLVGTLYLVINATDCQSLSHSSYFVIDEMSHYLKILLLSCVIVIVLYTFQYSKVEAWHSFECVIFILLSTISMMIMLSAKDFMTLYLTIELQSLCFYVLAASLRKSEYSVESGLKYFVLGALASGILLFGITLVYTFTGFITFDSLHLLSAWEALEGEGQILNPGFAIGILCIFVAMLFKLTAAPFHLWAPDVYTGAPTIITAFFALVPKIALIGVFTRIALWTCYGHPESIWNTTIIICAILSLVFGCFGALGQTNLKRLLAYSSINHVGYILLGFASGTPEGLESVFVYLFIYVLTTVAVFGIVLSFRQNKASASTSNVQYISDLTHLSKGNPTLAFSFTCVLFSLAGIPPLAGFFGKFYLFFGAVSSSLYVPALIAVLTSCVSCFYYLRLIKIMYFEMTAPWLAFPQMDQIKALCISLSLFGLLFLFAHPFPVYGLAQLFVTNLI